MTADFADQLDLSPNLRMLSHAYLAEFGHAPATMLRVPGTVTLLSRGAARLTVATPWGASAAATSRDDGVVELARLERPGERVRLTAGGGGANVLVSSEPPDGSGPGLREARDAAVWRCVDGSASGSGAGGPGGGTFPGGTFPGGAGPGHVGPHVMLGGRRLALDLAAAGLRLMIIDTRIRDVPLVPAPDEESPLEAAAEAIGAGDFRALGRLLTSAHVTRTMGGGCAAGGCPAAGCAAGGCIAGGCTADGCTAGGGDEAQDIAVSMALRAGALGARAIADGPGRPVLALVPASRLRDVRATVSGWFTGHEMRVPRFLTFTPPSGPAGAGVEGASGRIVAG